MKQCRSCGLSSPESVLYCQSCGTAFPATAPGPNASPLSELDSRDRKLCVFEIFLICFIAFGGGMLVSAYHLFAGLPQAGIREPFRWWYGICHELGALFLLWYVLKRQSKGFADIGFKWRWIDLAIAPVLWAVCFAAYYFCHFMIWAYVGSLLDSKMDAKVATYLFSGGVTLGTVLYGLLNPFFEELIVRGYLMTQLRQLGNNLAVVVTVSVLVQISYHFYQGVWAALSHIGEFLVLSIYFAMTKRIIVPILVHMMFDILPTLYYLIRPIH